MPRFAVTASDPNKVLSAQELAKRLGADYVTGKAIAAIDHDYLLNFTYDHLELFSENQKKPFFIDFLSGKIRHRCRQATLKKELLARSIGFKPKDDAYIIDATAGTGRDSFILATLGFHVTLIERSPTIHALLNDALERAKKSTLAPIAERLHLVKDDALRWLPQNDHPPQVIYLDPMFPVRQKSASVKKEMIILQNVLGFVDEQESQDLFKLALSCATHRVVVKRPRLAPYITGFKPNHTLFGKTSRFDIYLV